MDIKFDKHSLIIDGKREFIRSGAFHYFRSPGYNIALDRFSKMKAMGYNAVDLYFYWQYHSKKRGEYDFSGLKDVRQVLKAAKDVGLFVIARPGPFINAEVNAGGFPLWLLENKNVIPRNRIGTDYHYSEAYMELMREWYDVIVPIIIEFNDNVIAFQIENEYATDSMEEDYMRELYKMARDRGITCPIFHNDAYIAGLWADVVDIYACDIYPYINPNQNWKQDNFCFDTLDNVEEISRSAKEDSPIFIAEMQAGWFDKWDGSGYKHIRDSLGREHINIMTKTAISQGVTMFNHYMACGGTSWGDIACDEVYTSYEFAAPIDEYGIIQPNGLEAKKINYFLKSFGLTNTDPIDFDFYQENIYAKLRQDNENNCQWLFIRNMNPEKVTLDLPQGRNVALNPYETRILPQNLSLNACEIEFSGMEIFARIKNETDEIIFFITNPDETLYIKDREPISGAQKDFYNFKIEKENKSTQFVFLSPETADKTWIYNNKVIFNADYIYSNGVIAIENNTEIAYLDLEHGFSKKFFIADCKPELINLSDISVSFCAPEIDMHYNYSDWRKIDGATDSLSCGAYDEFVWYKAQIPQNLQEITLSARHLFAVYINGKEVLNRNSYKIEKLQQIPETIQIPLDNRILNRETNELTILVQNLGFDKGFSGDTNHPRGLVTFETVPACDIEFRIKEKLAFECGDVSESENPYLSRISGTFKLDMQDNLFNAKYLSLENFPYRRSTIFLNGVKIGRYIKRANVQEQFYLINEFLKPENQIDIIVWQKDRNIVSSWGFKNEMKNVIINIGDKKKYRIFKQ